MSDRQDHFPEIRETLYGVKARANFVYDALQRLGGATLSILDVGCGTGAYLSIPLARKGLRITGIDLDDTSIHYAREAARELGLANIDFRTDPIEAVSEEFDIVILSEVLEHVPEPEHLLKEARERLRPQGHLILTVPNGHGPFEIDQFFWKRNFMWIPSLYAKSEALVERLKRTHGRSLTVNTLNEDSPHINFFSWRALNELVSLARFEVVEYRPRCFLSGNYLGLLFNGLSLIGVPVDPVLDLNTRLASRLPPRVNSSWMFVCRLAS